MFIGIIATTGDFQYKQTRLSADEIWKNTKHLLLNGSRAHNVKMLYISTDEKKLDFFEPFWQNFTVRFLKVCLLCEFFHRISCCHYTLKQFRPVL